MFNRRTPLLMLLAGLALVPLLFYLWPATTGPRYAGRTVAGWEAEIKHWEPFIIGVNRRTSILWVRDRSLLQRVGI